MEREESSEHVGEAAGGTTHGAVAPVEVDRVVAAGSATDVAKLLAAQPARREQILRSLHQHRGNAFVAQVIGHTHAHAHAHAHADDHEHPADGEDATPVAGGRIDRFAGNAELDLVQAGTKVLKKGDKGQVVKKVQIALHDLGYPLNLHGAFDDRMHQAVVAFQTKAKITPANGEVNARVFDEIEDRLRSREAYANAAKETKPNHYQLDPPDAANPPAGILRHTHSLSNDEAAEAQRVLAPDPAAVPPFVRRSGADAYEVRLETLLRDEIVKDAAVARANNKQREKGHNFGQPHVTRVGNRAKQAVDRVFGSFAQAKSFDGRNLQDKYVAEKRDIEKATDPDAERAKKARQRVEKILNSDNRIEALNREHNAERTREPEKGLIEDVKTRVAKDLEDELIAIMLDWSGSASNGVVRLDFRKRGDDEANRERLWSMFGTLVHEYVHLLEHERWTEYKATRSKQNPEAGATLREGVTELLTRTVLAVTNLADKQLKRDIEGEYHDADFETPDNLRGGKYGTELGRAEQLAGVVGIHNVYGAYFIGQTRLVGAE